MKRFGIVGVGGFAATILRSILTVESEGAAHLEAAVVRHPAKYPDTVKRLEQEGRRLYLSLTEMLEKEHGQLDMVAIPTGIPYHAEMTVQALEAGLDVIVEKPVAATVQEVDAIIAAEKRTGHFCAVGYQHIHAPAMQTLREEVENGRLGKIRRMKCFANWPRGRVYYDRNGWAGEVMYDGRWVLDGPVTNALAHFLQNMFYLLGAETAWDVGIATLEGELYRANDIATYDTVALRAHMTTGADVLITLSHVVCENENPIIEIEAENATARWTFDGVKSVIHYRDGTIRSVETPSHVDFHAEAIRDGIAVAEGRRLRPRATPTNSRLHVLAVDLAFESCEGIHEIPQRYRKAVTLPNGDHRVEVPGMEEAVRRSFAEFKLFSELGLPWAHAARPVSGSDYVSFPQSPKLRAELAKLSAK